MVEWRRIALQEKVYSRSSIQNHGLTIVAKGKRATQPNIDPKSPNVTLGMAFSHDDFAFPNFGSNILMRICIFSKSYTVKTDVLRGRPAIDAVKHTGFK